MQVIKDDQIIDYPWLLVDDEAPLSEGNIILSLERYRDEKPHLPESGFNKDNIGISINSTTPVADFADELSDIGLVALDFQLYTDGRPFSQARLLRDQYKFSGDILAIGDLLKDQLDFMRRCGVNVFRPRTGQDLEGMLPMFSEITVRYQPELSQ